MNTAISLSKHEEFTMTFSSRILPGMRAQFGWAYVIGKSGAAKIRLVEASETTPPEETVQSPGAYASVVLQSPPPEKTEIKIIAGDDGFRGELQFDLLEAR